MSEIERKRWWRKRRRGRQTNRQAQKGSDRQTESINFSVFIDCIKNKNK